MVHRFAVIFHQKHRQLTTESGAAIEKLHPECLGLYLQIQFRLRVVSPKSAPTAAGISRAAPTKRAVPGRMTSFLESINGG